MQGQYSSKASPQEKTSSTMPTTSPKSSFTRLLLRPKPRPFKVLVLGQAEVGKSALVVRFITRRFIGEYDSSQEKTYTFQCEIDNEVVHFEILDSFSSCHQKGNLESNISWADAFILMYSVTDKCSFDECHRLKFLINYNKRRRRFAASMRASRREQGYDCRCGPPRAMRSRRSRQRTKEPIETPVVMVGNKSDQVRDRMVSTEAGRQRSKDIGCVCFHEISVRENIEQVKSVFRDTRRFWRVSNKWSRRDREPHPNALGRPISRSSADSSPEPVVPARTSSRRWTTKGADEAETSSSSYVGRSDSTSSSGQSECGEPFRARASTDSRLPPHPTRARHPVTAPFPVQTRRMSVSTKGNNTGTY